MAAAMIRFVLWNLAMFFIMYGIGAVLTACARLIP